MLPPKPLFPHPTHPLSPTLFMGDPVPHFPASGMGRRPDDSLPTPGQRPWTLATTGQLCSLGETRNPLHVLHATSMTLPSHLGAYLGRGSPIPEEGGA